MYLITLFNAQGRCARHARIDLEKAMEFAVELSMQFGQFDGTYVEVQDGAFGNLMATFRKGRQS